MMAAMAAAALALIGCSKETPAPEANPDEGVKSITLSINGGNMTKAQVTPDDKWALNAGISRLDIYFTTASDNIQYSKRIDRNTDETLWGNITGQTGNNKIRFIGMTNVSRVYVVANDTRENILTGGNISQIQADLANMYGSKANTDILYFGGDQELTPIGNEPADNVGATFDDTGAAVPNPDGDEDMSTQYYQANVTVRPAISRLEIGKIATKNAGQGEVSVQYNSNPEKTYVVEYTGFNPELVGIYMSNFYKSSPLFPNKTVIDDWTAELFATPGFNEGVSPIAEGKWTGLSDDQNDGISYANYNNGYQDFTTAHVGTTSGTTNYLFDGGSDADAVVVPFNFFVPYSLTDRSANADGVVDLGAACPALHFQFKKPVNPTFSCTSVQYYTSGSWQNVTDTNLEQQLQNAVAWPNNTDGIAYANVTKFFLDEDHTTELKVKPGLIYKVQEVVVEPVNLSVSTKDTDQFNVYVVVKVVGFDERNVYPVFD